MACADGASYRVIIGDCIEGMKTLADQSVNCCVTSPPYFGLRDYGQDGQIGLEGTPEDYIGRLVQVFREVRRVLRDDGTLWLNIGDSYNNFRSQMSPGQTVHGKDKLNGKPAATSRKRGVGTLKEKDLIGIPWMLAFALRADGWYLRQDIIWHKPNPMPESVRDRCTKAHEYIFLLSKSQQYYFDSEAVKEPAADSTISRDKYPLPTYHEGNIDPKGGGFRGVGGVDRNCADGKRNRRSVWTVNTRPYKGAHFAVFPPSLIEPCILAGCPKGGTVLDPFGGSGTTAGVAVKNGRKAILCELNPEYIDLVETRVNEISGNQIDLFAAAL